MPKGVPLSSTAGNQLFDFLLTNFSTNSQLPEKGLVSWELLQLFLFLQQLFIALISYRGAIIYFQCPIFFLRLTKIPLTEKVCPQTFALEISDYLIWHRTSVEVFVFHLLSFIYQLSSHVLSLFWLLFLQFFCYLVFHLLRNLTVWVLLSGTLHHWSIAF